MKCNYCGAEVTPGKNFCMFCGARLEQNPEPVREDPIPVNDIPEPEASVAEPVTAAAPVAAPVKAAPVAQPVYVAEAAPRLQLPTHRGLAKMFFLGILTLGIYPMVIWSRIVTELNIAASRYDGKRTMPYFAMAMLSPLTLGIYAFVWIHGFCNRIGDELKRRGINYKFGASTFWLWGILGSLIVVGPFVYLFKLMRSMNKINEDFNLRG